MVFETLDELIGMNNGFGDGAEEIRISLDLAVQVAGHVCQVVQGATEVLNQDSEISVCCR